MRAWRFLSCVLIALGPVAVRADVRLPAVISDHMVLQAGKPAAVWGWADPGEEVTLEIADQKQTATAATDGTWRVQLAPMQASAQPQVLTVSGHNRLTVNDVLIGEVWLASGQSNMEMHVKDPMHGSVDNADAEIAAATFPQIRQFVHEDSYSIYDLAVPPTEPLADRPGRWLVCSPETAEDFSAMGYFFARDLHRDLKSPVGIVLAAVGGTPIEAWTSREAQEAKPVLKPLLEDWQKRLSGFVPAQEQKRFLGAKKVWLKQRSTAVKKGGTPPKAPLPFKNLSVMKPGGLFNGHIAPLAPYTVQGCIWYQGERNAAGPFTSLYGEQLATLIADWRSRWGSEFYFAWVQLPRFGKPQRLPSEPKGWGVAVREGMLKTLSVAQTGMAITLDLGGEKDGHPTNKVDYAQRLSRVVLHDVYRKEIRHWSGPVFQHLQGRGKELTLAFDHAEGLRPKEGKLKGFAIAGADRKFVWAKARIEAGKVVVWNDSVAEPVAVRYGWAGNPDCNLVNGAGLPSSPFRTDGWAP